MPNEVWLVTKQPLTRKVMEAQTGDESQCHGELRRAEFARFPHHASLCSQV